MRRMPTGKELKALERIKVRENGQFEIYDVNPGINFVNENGKYPNRFSFNSDTIDTDFGMRAESGYAFSIRVNSISRVVNLQDTYGRGMYIGSSSTIISNTDDVELKSGEQTLRVTDSNVVSGPSVGSSDSIYLLNFGNDGSLVYYDSDIDRTVFDISPTATSVSATLVFNENSVKIGVSDVNETIDFYHGDKQSYVGYSQEDGFTVFASGTTLSLYGENGIIAKQNLRQPAVYLSGTIHPDETTTASIGSYSIKYMPLYDENGDVVGGQGTIAIDLTTSASGNTIYLSGDLSNNFIGGVANISANQVSLIGGYTGVTRAKIVFVQVTPQAGTYEGAIMIYNN